MPVPTRTGLQQTQSGSVNEQMALQMGVSPQQTLADLEGYLASYQTETIRLAL